MFMITMGKGFRIKFENDWSISVQWGPGNYCKNNYIDMMEFYATPASKIKIQSEDAEIAIFKPDNSFYRPEEWSDDVLGHVEPRDVLKWMNFVSQQ